MNENRPIYDLSYYTLQETEVFRYYNVPQVFFVDERFTQPKHSEFSSDAKLLYSMLLNRVELSRGNKWTDKDGRVYIIYTNKQIQAILKCRDKKVTKLLGELDSVGLIERDKKTMLADKIYVKNFMSPISKNCGEYEFNYLTLEEIGEYEHYRVPKLFFESEKYTNHEYFKFTTSAKLLYGILLENLSLSKDNEWVDEFGRVYVVFKNKEIQEALGCKDNKATKLLQELETIGLIKRNKQTRCADQIYIKNFASDNIYYDFENEYSKNTAKFKMSDKYDNDNVYEESGKVRLPSREKYDYQSGKARLPHGKSTITSREKYHYPVGKSTITQSGKIRSREPDYREPYSSNPNLSIKEQRQQNFSMHDLQTQRDMIDEIESYIKNKISYDYLIIDYPYRKENIDEIVYIMLEMSLWSEEYYYIGKTRYLTSLVQRNVAKINHSHMQYMLDCLDDTTSRIGDIKSYLAKVIYNAGNTIDTYFQTKVSHDMSQPKYNNQQEYDIYKTPTLD